MRNILIIGYGTLGKATEQLLNLSENKDKFTIHRYDTGIAEYNTNPSIDHFDLAIICINFKNNCILDDEFNTLKDTLEKFKADNYILRSTVVPMTTKRLKEAYTHVYFMPEYLREREGFDAQMPVMADIDGKEVFEYYFTRNLHLFTSTELELSKLIQNSFFATKVIYFNLVAEFVTKMNLDYERVRECFMTTARHTGHIHDVGTIVPYNDEYGYGGKCLPKDLISFYNIAHLSGATALSTFLAEIHNHNQDIRSVDESINSSIDSKQV